MVDLNKPLESRMRACAPLDKQSGLVLAGAVGYTRPPAAEAGRVVFERLAALITAATFAPIDQRASTVSRLPRDACHNA